MSQPIFSELFLSNYLYDFKLSNIPNIRKIKHHVEFLIKELESGKFSSLKEEAIKSRFVTTFFGDILNFNYGNAHTWMLREEKKSITDATKPDAVLGYFFIDQKGDDVRGVIEMKDANTDLDEKQKRQKSISAVEQGFSYAHKCGGKCKWVIITNINEIRFYRADDSSRYQVYMLNELADENKLKELLFLFHKDRFIKHALDERSNTDMLFEISKLKSESECDRLHIIDKIYFSLKRFEELSFVSPDYLASIKPFNILDEYVWHYHGGRLFTINTEIYKLLINISISDQQVILSDDLKSKLAGRSMDEVIERLLWSFKFLNRCLITEIHAVRDYIQACKPQKNVIKIPKTHIFGCEDDNIAILQIDLFSEDDVCDCLICNYRNFDFDRLIRKLKQAEGTPDSHNMQFAFANFLLSSNDYRTPYFILNEIRNITKNLPEKGVTYFLATLNITFLYHRIQMSAMEDTEKIRSDIRSIDLDKVLYNELEFYVEKEVLEYLKKVKEDDLIIRVQDNVEDLFVKINDLKKIIDHGGSQSGPDYAYNLLSNYEKCFKHHYGNSIFYVKFDRYKRISERILQALVTSYNTPVYGLIFFSDFILTESILNISSSKLQEVLSKQDMIAVDNETLDELLIKLKNLLGSYVRKNFLDDYATNDLFIAQLGNWEFGRHYCNIFSNIFTVLSRIDLSKEKFEPLIKLLLGFLNVEDELAHFDLKELENFILKRGDLFEEKELEYILNIAIKRSKMHNHKYDGLLQKIPEALLRYKPAYRYSNVNLVKRLLLNCERDDGTFKNYRRTVSLSSIADESCVKILRGTFKDFLDNQFDEEFYGQLLRAGILKFNEENYFEKYINHVNNLKRFRTFELENVQPISLIYLNFILLISKLEIDVELEYFKKLTDLNPFEHWMLNPKKFDYQFFNSEWLVWVEEYTNFLRRLAKIPELLDVVERRLEKDYHSSIAKIKYKFLNAKYLTYD
ncbi:hypothetical protein ABE426_05480 [Sphingobacterium faecium]|uniref:hypothetical protein n=1 Tax=Sphingobacterium faecium TaxID=34087 RepID=UPI00320AA9EE